MRLPDWTANDACEHGNYLEDMSHERELAMHVTEIVEDLLSTHRIVVPDEDAPSQTWDGRREECIGPLYGCTYDTLISDIADEITNYLSSL